MKFGAYLINMKKDSDRLAFMSEQLERLDINFTKQEGIDGKTSNFEGLCSDRGSVSMNSREKAIALSHKSILENMKRENLDYALVLEDDVELPHNFKKIIEREMSKRTKNKTKWEYLSFNYPTVGLHFVRLWLFLFFRMFKENTSFVFYLKIPLYLIKFIFIVIISMFERTREMIYIKLYEDGKPTHFYRPLYLAGCYLITKKGAEKLLSLNDKITYTADELPNAARIKSNLKFYAFVPLLVKQRRDKFYSKLEADKAYYFTN